MLREGGDVLLKLVAREPGTTLALPRDAAEMFAQQDDIPFYHVAEVIEYARFMKGGEDYMIDQYNLEMDELQEQEKEDELMFGEDTTWTRKALAAISDAKEKMEGIGNPPDAPKQPERPTRPPIIFGSTEEIAPEMYNFQGGTRSGQSLSSNRADSRSEDSEEQSLDPAPFITDLDQLKIAPESNSSSHSKTSEKVSHRGSQAQHNPVTHHSQSHTFYFYQALPNFYLSPLDIRILKAAFGSFSSFPSTILPRVEHISTGHVVDDDLRRRAKYLAHLPYGCEVNFLECDWTGSVSPNLLQQFSAEITRRRQKNQEKARREEKERQVAEQKEKDQTWAAARRKRPSLSDKPHFSDADFAPLAHVDGLTAEGTANDSSVISSSPPWATPRAQSSSFATLASPGTSPEAPRTVWGTAAAKPSSPYLLPEPETLAPVDDGWLQGWEEDLLDGGDAVAMVEASLAGEASSSKNISQVHSGGGGKKKKGKKITLMSTNARRGA